MKLRHGHYEIRRAGGVLLEVLLSIALFVGAAGFSLGVLRSVLDAIDRSGRQAMAVDLARAKMAELEAGLTTIAELREASDGLDRVGSIESFGGEDEFSAPTGEARWIVDVDTTRSEFTGLSLVELTVSEETEQFADEDAVVVSYTLRQLMQLREDEEEEYEADDLMRGLPTEPEGR